MTKQQANSQQNEGGRLRAAFLVLAGVLAVFLSAVLVTGHAAHAASPLIGVDMTPETSGASSSDGITPCTEVRSGDQFAADVVVANADRLVAWELRVDFNPDLVSLDSADYAFLLTENGGQILGPVFDQESSGRFFLGAASPGSGNGGSGTLARLHMTALKNGISPISITSSPSFYGPRLTAAGGAYFGDSNGDGIFDGRLTGGNIAVGRSCSAITPAPTATAVYPTATPKAGSKTPAPTLAPGQTPGPTNSGSGGGDGGSDGGGTDGNGGNETDGGGTNGGSQSGTTGTPVPSNLVNNIPGSDSGSESDGGSNSANNGGTGVGNSGNEAAIGSTGGGSSNLILIIAGVFAALAVAVGAGLLIMRNRISR